MAEAPPRTAALVGLGVGSIAAYGKPGRKFTYYEIDPIVCRIASDPKWFTFLHDSKAQVNIVLGDARLELAKSTETYDLIVLDAFSSDAIPVHLLTTQAIQMYLRHLNPDGMLLFHTSNRYLELTPILAAAAHKLGLEGYYQDDAATPDELAIGKTESQWAVMARSQEPLNKLKLSWWDELDPTTKQRAWTDDYSDVIAAFNPNK
jgi:spermidine synthase